MKRVLAPLLLSVLTVASCTRSNMDSQPKDNEYKPSGLFRDGKVLQAPVPGTVARGDLARADEATKRPRVTAELLQRGRVEYDVYCSPCHDRVGTGRGIVVQRGMPQPVSLHDVRQRAATDQHLFDVISNGVGAMYAHGDRVRPRDRWAIVAYIRALQLSQHAALDDVPADQQTLLNGEKP
jgi:mono/diheme cytochrome c family protein